MIESAPDFRRRVFFDLARQVDAALRFAVRYELPVAKVTQPLYASSAVWRTVLKYARHAGWETEREWIRDGGDHRAVWIFS